MRFPAVLALRTKTATTITVPEEVIAALGAGKRPRVRVTLGGHVYRTSLAIMGGEALLPVSADVRQAAGIAAGDDIDVDIEVDAEPREIVVPDDLAAAFDADGAAARRVFDSLPEGQRRRIVQQVQDAKTTATRERRIAKNVTALSEQGSA